VGHVPAYYNHKPSARRGYLFDDVSPLYAFGFGLSYTTFELSDIRLEPSTIEAAAQTRVHAKLTNTGSREGSEVVQLYIRDRVSSVTRPVKELKGFKRITLAPGQSTTVSFDITSESLAFYDLSMDFVVEPGTFDIMVGTSSRSEDLQTVKLEVSGPPKHILHGKQHAPEALV
jgi:beta-glucosidase